MPEAQPPPKGFVLGIDLGTTYSAAAIMRGSVVETCVLGTIAAQIPSVVVHREDSEILTGEAAERRATSEPTRTAREFKRRLGDPVPMIVGGTPYGAEALMAEMLEAIVRQVTQREGARPTVIVLTHPANYSEYKRGLLREAARLAGLDLDRVQLITEPEAAAITYAHQQRIDPGEVIAVYDLGGGTFDAAVVRDTPAGFELIGTPEGMERLGGIDFDQAVLFHVDAALDGLVSAADSSDPQVLAGQARLRDECRRAKEALSNDTDATIAVSLPGVQTEVRLTRDELEQMVRPRIAETVRALQRTIASAGITTDDVSRVLLVGGSSRMPIVAQVVREAIGRPVSTDADPKLAIAIGAALSAGLASSAVATSPTPLGTSVTPATPAPQVTRAGSSPVHTARRRRARLVGIVAAALAGLAVAAVIVFATRGSDDTAGETAGGSSTSPVAIPATASTGAVTATTATAATGPTEVTVASGTDGAPERLAFDGTDQGTGIPGSAVAAGAPGAVLGVATDSSGDVYVITADIAVLRISDGQVDVVPGFEAADAPAAGVAVGADGSVFVANAAGIVRVKNGSRELVLDGPAAGLSSTLGPLALDGSGSLYITDNGTSRIVRRAPDGALTLVAGTGTPAIEGSVPEDGAVAAASAIGLVTGLVIDRNGSLLMTDTGLGRVRAVAGDGTINTLAGGGTVSLDALAGSGVTLGTDLFFTSAAGITVDAEGRVYVADSAVGSVVRIGPDGRADLAPGIPEGVPIGEINAIAISPAEALIFSDGLVVWSIAAATQAG